MLSVNRYFWGKFLTGNYDRIFVDEMFMLGNVPTGRWDGVNKEEKKREREMLNNGNLFDSCTGDAMQA